MLHGALSFPDPWTLNEDQLRAGAATGALFTTSNGHVGLRAGRAEPLPSADDCVLVNGYYETRPYAHPEQSFGLPERYQTIVPVTGPGTSLTVAGEAMLPDAGTWLERHRSLDLRTGCVSTTGTWRSPEGRRAFVRSRRIASLPEPGLVWWEVEVEPLDGPAPVEVVSELRAYTGDRTYPEEPDALGRAWGRVLQAAGTLDVAGCLGLAHTTAISRRTVACVLAADADVAVAHRSVSADEARLVHRFDAAPGRPARVGRRTAYAQGSAGGEALLATAAGLATASSGTTFDTALDGQRAVLDERWEAAAVEVAGAPDVEAAVRFSVFQVLQSVTCDPDLPTPAKGLTGQRYQGHQLWDQEVYSGQVLSLVAPDLARHALEFRHRTLPAARVRASELGHRGAKFPWRTIDGTEASAFFPAGSAQHHLDADIAFAVEHYAACSGDDAFLVECGVELLVETARLWMCVGHAGRDGRFRIDSVTGPDEYTALVDNNLYTNVLAAANLEAAADRVEWLAATDAAAHRQLTGSLQLGPDEPASWRAAAATMWLPYDDELGVHGQDDTFLGKARWDLEATPPEDFPLQLHRHLLDLYRHQVVKQADVVLAHFLQGHRFTPEQRRRDFDHYEPLTVHDSSLSAPIHAVVAADVGRPDLAWRYARESALVDLDERHGSLRDGLHVGAAAGSWLALVCGFGGLRIRDGMPCFRPTAPPGVDRLCFRIRFRGRLLEVAITPEATSYVLVRGDALTICHGDEALTLEPGHERDAAVHRRVGA